MQAHEINLINLGSRIEGTIECDGYTRFNGTILGTLRGRDGSEIILGEHAVVEGTIDGDVVIIDGFVRGTVRARTKIVISETGRLVGQLHAPNVTVKFGAFFDGSCTMTTIIPF